MQVTLGIKLRKRVRNVLFATCSYTRQKLDNEKRRRDEVTGLRGITWKRMERISWKNIVSNQEVLGRVGEKRRVLILSLIHI